MPARFCELVSLIAWPGRGWDGAKDAWEVWGTGSWKKRTGPDGYRLGIVLRPFDTSNMGCSVFSVYAISTKVLFLEQHSLGCLVQNDRRLLGS